MLLDVKIEIAILMILLCIFSFLSGYQFYKSFVCKKINKCDWTYLPSHGNSIRISFPAIISTGGSCFPRYQFLIAVTNSFFITMARRKK